MNIRIMGTLDEVTAASALLEKAGEVLEISEPYANRGRSKLYRVYITLGHFLPAAKTAKKMKNVTPQPKRLKAKKG